MEETSRRTLRHYEEGADAFWEGTRDHDVTQNIDALLSSLPEGGAGARVLDFGCGPGRDLKTLTERGALVTGLDGCEAFCEMARAYSGCDVIHQDFLALDLPAESFEGIFANASLFHVPTAHLKAVLGVLFSALVPGGVLFSSNPRGGGEEGWNAERYGVYHDFERWSQWVCGSGFTPLRHYYRPEGLPCAEQHWLASLWEKPVTA
ncbi:MAG: class I SAM-dependent methyltransferase [Myxococcota bacterium]|nr:class I SAM-dependent methyltransferase [Myxococcota bacterium]